MDANVNAIVSVAGACLAIFALVSAMIALQSTRHWRTRCRSLDASVAALRREFELTACDDVAAQPLEPASGSLDEAIEWARGGADSARLVQQFGLSSGEATLIARLHGRTKIA